MRKPNRDFKLFAPSANVRVRKGKPDLFSRLGGRHFPPTAWGRLMILPPIVEEVECRKRSGAETPLLFDTEFNSPNIISRGIS